MESVKCVVVGDGAVGKTCALISYTTNCFPTDHVPTIFDNYSTCAMSGNTAVQVNLWDTAGQEDYDNLRPLSYPQTDVFFVAFSLVSRTSLSNVESKWLPELRRYCPSVPIVLVGTKKDLTNDSKVVAQMAMQGMKPISLEEGESMAAKLGCAKFVEISSCTQEGIHEAFGTAIDVALKARKQQHTRRKHRDCTVL